MASFGEELRRERELREISLREITETTKVRVSYLEALESNEFELLPGGVFNKGFVRAYCEFIGVDSEAMVNAYLLEERARAEGGADIDPNLLRGRESTHADPTAPGSGPAWNLLLRTVGLFLLLLVLIAAGFWIYRSFIASPVSPTETAAIFALATDGSDG